MVSYDVFPVGQLMPRDLAEQTVRAVGASFYIGFSIAVPFHLMGLLLNLGMGLADRTMAALPVFFVAAPVLIATAFPADRGRADDARGLMPAFRGLARQR